MPWASLATLVFGAVLGPEAPLLLIGSGLAVLIARLIKRDAPKQAIVLIGAAGGFAAASEAVMSGDPGGGTAVRFVALSRR